MKYLIVSILLLFSSQIFGQKFHVPGDTIRGDSATYYFAAHYPQFGDLFMTVHNVSNVDTTLEMYFDDNRVLPDHWELTSTSLFSLDDIADLVKNELTTTEYNQLKGGQGFLGIDVVADQAGNALELTFLIRREDPVFARMNSNRWFKLEKKLKNILKMKVSSLDRRIVNIKYTLGIYFQDWK